MKVQKMLLFIFPFLSEHPTNGLPLKAALADRKKENFWKVLMIMGIKLL